MWRSAAVRALAFLVLATTLAAPAAGQGDGEARPLPTPGDDVPGMNVVGFTVAEGGVVVQWVLVEGAARYEVYANPTSEAPPLWTPGDGSIAVNSEQGYGEYRDMTPPTPRGDRSTVSFAVLALDASGAPVAEGRTAIDPSAPPPSEVGDGPATSDGVVSAVALAVWGIAALVAVILVLSFFSRRGRSARERWRERGRGRGRGRA